MATTTPNYDINYDDERFQAVEADKNTAMFDFENTYQGIIDNVDEQYAGLQDAIKQNAETQKQNQQANTDFTIEKIEQQKDKAHKDYLKEQSGAYKDWQKESDQYGVNAEQMAASGMTNTGFSESSQVAMYNQYQNRVTTAREVLSTAMLNYDNNIKEAMLQNNSILAEIEAEAAIKAAELALEGFQYKNNLVLEMANKKIELDNIYYNRWQDVLNQMNTENAMKFEADQAELNRQFQTKEAELDRAHDLKIQQLDQAFEEKMAQVEQQYKLDYLKAQTEEEKKLIQEQHDKDMLKLEKQHEYEKAILDKKLENDKAYLDYQRQTSGGSGTIKGGGSGGGSSKGGSTINRVGIHDKESGTNTQKPTVDSKSVMALGKGPISAKTLADLVATGQVSATQQGNKIVVKSNGSLAAGQSVLDKYTWMKTATNPNRGSGKGGKF
jgi:hypothetical protein